MLLFGVCFVLYLVLPHHRKLNFHTVLRGLNFKLYKICLLAVGFCFDGVFVVWQQQI